MMGDDNDDSDTMKQSGCGVWVGAPGGGVRVCVFV
jgi:hypothetical protein